ncbi:MAG: hypothetical protein COS95_08855 [Ignavibacteriales bacterium CG07_land_8_20_14_0_80_59_12]|nr:MAG: hypothetical protein COS95_08855 [Ignavibacteriales bacterium CG07_land_8_20_14_0_80_59_12]
MLQGSLGGIIYLDSERPAAQMRREEVKTGMSSPAGGGKTICGNSVVIEENETSPGMEMKL